MDTSTYDRYLTEQDRRVIELSGYGRATGTGRRPALLVIDVTYGFCGDRPEPILDSVVRFRSSSGQAAWDAVEVIGGLAAAARGHEVPVVYTTGTAPDPAAGAGPRVGNNSRAAEDTAQRHEIVAPLAPRPGDLVLRKAKPSAFFGTPLLSHLIARGVDSLVVCGGTTSGCVRATVVDAFSYNLPVTVVSDGCFDRITASHAIGLFDLSLKYAAVLPSERALDLLAPSQPA